MNCDKFVDQVMELDWGCGCCGVATSEELREEIKKILGDFEQAVRLDEQADGNS